MREQPNNKQAAAMRTLVTELTKGMTPEQRKKVIERIIENPFSAIADHFCKGKPKAFRKKFTAGMIREIQIRRATGADIHNRKKRQAIRERN